METVAYQHVVDVLAELYAGYTFRANWFANTGVYAKIQWLTNRPVLRRLYRGLGNPFGQNDGAFKRWVLTRPAKFWQEIREP